MSFTSNPPPSHLTPTPGHWRWVKLAPAGELWRLVALVSGCSFSERDLAALGLHGKSARGLKQDEAMKLGEAMEKILREGQPRKRKPPAVKKNIQ